MCVPADARIKGEEEDVQEEDRRGRTGLLSLIASAAFEKPSPQSRWDDGCTFPKRPAAAVTRGLAGAICGVPGSRVCLGGPVEGRARHVASGRRQAWITAIALALKA